MTISGRIRDILKILEFPGAEQSLFALMARKALGTLEKNWSTWDTPEALSEQQRWARVQLAQSGHTRLLSDRFDPEALHPLLVARVQGVQRHAEDDLRRTDIEPAKLLWHHWHFTLAQALGGPQPDPHLLHDLWQKGTSLQENKEAAPFHRLTPDTLLDAFVYDDLVALHAACSSAKTLNNPDMMQRVRSAVRWHVENTQPDNTTNEPWALAAFAALDDTGTFAEQQLHDTVTHLKNAPPPLPGRIPVAVGLLADALFTLEAP